MHPTFPSPAWLSIVRLGLALALSCAPAFAAEPASAASRSSIERAGASQDESAERVTVRQNYGVQDGGLGLTVAAAQELLDKDGDGLRIGIEDQAGDPPRPPTGPEMNMTIMTNGFTSKKGTQKRRGDFVSALLMEPLSEGATGSRGEQSAPAESWRKWGIGTTELLIVLLVVAAVAYFLLRRAKSRSA